VNGVLMVSSYSGDGHNSGCIDVPAIGSRMTERSWFQVHYSSRLIATDRIAPSVAIT
jgi:hypothetical protein